jgi:AraC family transcriptional regulator
MRIVIATVCVSLLTLAISPLSIGQEGSKQHVPVTSEEAKKWIAFLEGEWEGKGTGPHGNFTHHVTGSWDLNKQFMVLRGSLPRMSKVDTPLKLKEELAILGFNRQTESYAATWFSSEGWIMLYLGRFPEKTNQLYFNRMLQSLNVPDEGLRSKHTIKKLSDDKWILTYESGARGEQIKKVHEIEYTRVGSAKQTEAPMKVEVGVKTIDPMWVVSLPRIGPYSEAGKAIYELFTWIGKKKVDMIGAPLGIFYDNPQKVDPKRTKYEVCVPVAASVETDSTDEVISKQLPEQTVVYAVHRGPYKTVGESYGKIEEWMKKEGYKAAGPYREIYFNDPREVAPEDLKTELQIPVIKK